MIIISRQRGVGFVDTIIGVAILAIVFFGIFGAFRLGLQLVADAKARGGATALVNEKMEFIRSLPYDEVGTEGGIPSGDIPQEESIMLNGISYTRRVFIQYKDAPQDGTGDDDENGITEDYKVVKVESQWSQRGESKEVSVVSNIVPPGIESTEGGGTLGINVFDADASPVADARIDIFNDSTTSTIDVTTYTDGNGDASFPGAPESDDYEVTVRKPGYSTSTTYDATSENPNPSPGHQTVTENNITSTGFAIDILSEALIETYEPVRNATYTDAFKDAGGISSSEGVTISNEQLVVTNTSATGTAYSVDITDQYLNRWKTIKWSDSEPADSNIIYQLYYTDDGARTLVPDTALSGNSTGFDDPPVDISNLSTSTYSQLQLNAFLDTADDNTSPAIDDWQITYTKGPIPLPNVPFTVRGEKTIGTDADGNPIYKYNKSHQTDSSAELRIDPLEWDTYHVSIDNSSTGKQIHASCPPLPITLLPATSKSVDLILDQYDPHALRVTVTDTNDNILKKADVRLTRSDTDITKETGRCGQVMFAGQEEGTLDGEDTYSLQISRSGYQTKTVDDVEISNVSSIIVSLYES